jgi:hypothetical protein
MMIEYLYSIFIKNKADDAFLSRQYGTRESKDVTLEGRVQFDLLQVVIYCCTY